MLNDINPPPPEPQPESRAPARTVRPQVNAKEPGRHHPRVVGEPTHIDPEYAMPMEDRGSTFNIGLTITVIVIVFIVLMWILLSFYRR